jgi:tetratricopeptide (TPR) repeat protein
LLQEARLSFSLRKLVTALILAALPCAAQLPTKPSPTKASLDVSETLFAIVSAINVCGYDHELAASSPIRMQVRVDLVQASESPQVATAADAMCRFYREHPQSDAGHDLAAYVSLALNVGNPPDFTPKWQEADIPPDAADVLGFLPLLKAYASAAKLHSIWLKHQPQYNDLIEQYHAPVAKMITATDVYLRMPLAVDPGRSYTIYLEPMGAPGQVNSRNYRDDFYYMVISPVGDNLHLQQLRHTYLHYVLDPLIARRGTALERIKPILASVQNAPLAEEYREDVGLLLVESLIRAIEAHTPPDSKLPEQDRVVMVKHAESEGYILTGYFYDRLKIFERSDTGLKDAFPDWLHNLDVQEVKKHAGGIQFASTAEPELTQASKRQPPTKVERAERALASGNPANAAQLANEALAAKEDTARAYFVLARVATLNGNMQDARDNFAKALQAAKDPRIAAWCHIYLGRILDLQDDREDALVQYKAALDTGDVSAETKAAAERGLKAPYQPPTALQQQPQ